MSETTYRTAQSLVVAQSASKSGALDLEFRSLVGIQCPSALEATSARVVFEGSNDDSTFVPLYDSDGTRLQCTVTTSRADGIALDPSDFVGWRYIKIEITTTDAATGVAQATAARTFTILSRMV